LAEFLVKIVPKPEGNYEIKTYRKLFKNASYITYMVYKIF